MPGENTAQAQGGCSCGQVRYQLQCAPMLVHCCHCHSCQRETGSAFVLNALIETSAVLLLSGQPKPVPTPSFSGRGQTILRCPECEVALWSHYAGAGPAIAFVRVGTLDERAKFPPDVHIYTESRQPWLSLPAATPVFAEFYDPRQFWSAAVQQRWRAARS